MKIDFHIAKFDGEESAFFDSLQILPDCCSIHNVQSVKGHIGKTRRNGFLMGESELVSYVDPDDEMDFSYLPEIIKIFENRPDVDAVCTKERVRVDGEHLQKSEYSMMLPPNGESLSVSDSLNAHHLVIYRRSTINKYVDLLLEWPGWPEHALNISMVKDGCNFVSFDKEVYTWSLDSKKETGKSSVDPTFEVVNLIRFARGFAPLERDFFDDFVKMREHNK